MDPKFNEVVYKHSKATKAQEKSESDSRKVERSALYRSPELQILQTISESNFMTSLNFFHTNDEYNTLENREGGEKYPNESPIDEGYFSEMGFSGTTEGSSDHSNHSIRTIEGLVINLS